MMNSVGALKLAATVCPTSYDARDDDAVDGRGDDGVLEVHLVGPKGRLRLRERGQRRPQLRLGWTSRSPPPCPGRPCVSSFRSKSSRARAAFTFVSSSVTFRRSTSACDRTRFALACSIWVWSIVGSSRAMTWPFLTIELKSAYSSWMMPGHLGADLDRRDRIERAGGADALDDVAAGHGRGGDLGFGTGPGVVIPAHARGHRRDDNEGDDRLFHIGGRLLTGLCRAPQAREAFLEQGVHRGDEHQGHKRGREQAANHHPRQRRL